MFRAVLFKRNIYHFQRFFYLNLDILFFKRISLPFDIGKLLFHLWKILWRCWSDFIRSIILLSLKRLKYWGSKFIFTLIICMIINGQIELVLIFTRVFRVFNKLLIICRTNFDFFY